MIFLERHRLLYGLAMFPIGILLLAGGVARGVFYRLRRHNSEEDET